jgi:hypothetical protein
MDAAALHGGPVRRHYEESVVFRNTHKTIEFMGIGRDLRKSPRDALALISSTIPNAAA